MNHFNQLVIIELGALLLVSHGLSVQYALSNVLSGMLTCALCYEIDRYIGIILYILHVSYMVDIFERIDEMFLGRRNHVAEKNIN